MSHLSHFYYLMPSQYLDIIMKLALFAYCDFKNVKYYLMILCKTLVLVNFILEQFSTLILPFVMLVLNMYICWYGLVAKIKYMNIFFHCHITHVKPHSYLFRLIFLYLIKVMTFVIVYTFSEYSLPFDWKKKTNYVPVLSRVHHFIYTILLEKTMPLRPLRHYSIFVIQFFF